MSAIPDPNALEAAIRCGRIYSPANSSFVPGYLVARAGMVTLYDSNLIPTFESELEFVSGTQPRIQERAVPEPDNAGKAPPVIYRQKKNYCC